ncbi:MAG: NADP-dependent oxidoreductase [Geminicoccaceae bacterium]|nr:NADP-dependent oxidoreductase [Geminicoccaceae bacterium]
MTINRQWLLKAHPEGMPAVGDFELVERPLGEPADGELLVRADWLSVDPYMRGRISRQQNYAAGVRVGEVMTGGGVGEVLSSRHPAFAAGDVVESFGFGWQEFPVIAGEGAHKIDPSLGPVQSALSYLGLPGLTAYFALLDQGRPKPGETVVVSAASGAVGQVAGQIAKIMEARAVAIASSDEKLDWCRELGYDAGINYRTSQDLTTAIADACPNGVDVFFDNTAGPIHDAVMANLAPHARVIICGTVALADRFEQPDVGLRHLRKILVTRATVRGFLLFDYVERYDEGRRQLALWANEGRIRHREDVLDGIERMPEAFLRLLTSRNLGKQLVRLRSSEG